MTDGKRFEDKVEIADLLKQPQKEILARIYQQVLKTNGTVSQNCKDITSLQDDMKDKIGIKLFATLTAILSVLIIAFNVINMVMK
jgi:hypothetical protein